MKKYIVALSILLCVSVALAAPQGTPKHIEFKGLNTSAGPLNLDDGESPDALNVHSNIFGTLVKRNGYADLSAASHTHITTSPGKINALLDYAVSTTTRKLVSVIDDEFYKMDNLDGSFDNIILADTLSDDYADLDTINNTLIINSWSRDRAQFWDGTSAHTGLIAAMPLGKYITKAYTRMFTGNILDGSTEYPLRFYFSTGGSYTAWQATNYETCDAPEGDEIMGWGNLRGRLYCFTKYTVNFIEDQGGAYPMTVKRYLNGIGCGARRSIKTVVTSKFGEVLVWLSNDKKLYAWDGSGINNISEKIFSSNNICPFSMSGLSSTYLYKAHAQVYEKEGWYVLFVPTGTNVNYAIIWDYKANSLWVYSNQNFNSSAIVETTFGNLMYVGDLTGTVSRWDYGATDDSAAINGYWTSRKWDWGFYPALKKMGEVQMSFKTLGNYNVYFQERYNWSTSWSTAEALVQYNSEWLLGGVLPAILGGNEAVTHRYSIGGAFNSYQMKLYDNSTNPAFELYSLDTISMVEGASN